MTQTGTVTEPAITITRGNPTDDELAALVVVLLTRSAPAGRPVAAPSGWSAYRRSVRVPVQPGPGAWRMSGRV